jgi:hypothetical protein
MQIAIHAGQDVGQLDPAGSAVFLHLDRCNQIQPQKGKVVEIVLGKGFTAQVRVDKAESPESSRTPAQPPYVGKIKVRRVSKDHVANNSVARE